MRKTLIVGILLATVGTAAADTTYTFKWDHGEPHFIKFPSADYVAQETSSDSWDADVSVGGSLTGFIGNAAVAHPTGKTLHATPLKAKLVIEDVTGSVNLNTNNATWTITAHVNFSVAGYVSEGSCKTSTFTVYFNGNYYSGTDTSEFTIAALSGSGSQACSGDYSAINTDFALGNGGAKLHFDKFTITPT